MIQVTQIQNANRVAVIAVFIECHAVIFAVCDSPIPGLIANRDSIGAAVDFPAGLPIIDFLEDPISLVGSIIICWVIRQEFFYNHIGLAAAVIDKLIFRVLIWRLLPFLDFQAFQFCISRNRRQLHQNACNIPHLVICNVCSANFFFCFFLDRNLHSSRISCNRRGCWSRFLLFFYRQHCRATACHCGGYCQGKKNTQYLPAHTNHPPVIFGLPRYLTSISSSVASRGARLLEIT